ncbi:hypothetical protein ACFXAE_11870 [Streptomyces sp. NPDC059454]|uniref:hypothetical protein n=1 Tax=Streptomyces sp. NPDC059454 TaxID=3346836 RepID=UPI003697BF8F
MAEVASVPAGYRLLLPSDWLQIPLRQGTTAEIERAVAAEVFARAPGDVPRDKLTPLRLEVERRLRAVVADAHRTNALEIYLPVRLAGERNLGASIVVSEARLPSRSAADGPDVVVTDPVEVAARLLSKTPGTGVDLSSGEVDGALAVRRDQVMAADPGRGAEMDSRRVDYLVSVPGEPGLWFMAAFSTIGGGDPRDDLAEALVEWFDALMATFRWSWA